MELKIISYNCQSFKSNIDIVKELLHKCDVLFLQETLIDDNNFSLLDQIDDDFMSAYLPATRKVDCFVGRSRGGLAVLWRKGTVLKFTPVNYENRIMGLKVFSNIDSVMLILNVYMPCDYGNEDSYLEYRSSLADISNILNSENYINVCIVGDFVRCNRL